VVAVAEGGRRGEVREYRRIANTPTAVARLARQLSRDGVRLRFCYEAGPCGYGIQRQLSGLGYECVVVAPSLIPKGAGDRVKTDRRDAASLARLNRAGELTAVWVPDAGHEAMRDLVRARLAAVQALCRARQQLAGFRLRQGRHYGRPAWTKLHRRWLAGLKFEQPVPHIVLEDYIAAVEAAEVRRDRLTAQIETMLGDLSRFANPRQLMAYLGLVPSEHSSGTSIKTRRSHQGRQRHRPSTADRGGLVLPDSRPASAVSCCSARRRSRGRSVRPPGRRSCGSARGTASSPAPASPANVVTAAIARELAGFLWAVARQVTIPAG